MSGSPNLKLLLLALTLSGWISLAAESRAADRKYTVSAQALALAPNAGGQEAYTLRLATNEWEGGVFSNQYILAGDKPLTGAFYDLRFPICDDSCFWQFFVQTGAGLSNGGPLAQITWGTVIPLLPIWLPFSAPRYVPSLRLDITTQMIFIRYRAVTWSYPLWAGISVAF